MSVYNDILEALAAAIRQIPGIPEVTVRELPLHLPADAGEACFVCPLDGEGERVGRVVFGGDVRWHFPVLVLLLRPSNRAVAAGMATRLQVRQDVEDLVYMPVLEKPGVPGEYLAGLYNVDIDPKAAADVAAALGTNFIVTGFAVVYHVNRKAGWVDGSIKKLRQLFEGAG